MWKIVRSEGPTESEVRMTFHPDGRLIYSIYLKEKIQTINLTYRICGDTIISDQPSHPQEELTHFSIETDGTLVLENNGLKSWLRKLSSH